MGLARELLNGLSEIIYPKTCHVCHKKITHNSIEGLVCIECWSKIKPNLPSFCPKCGRNIAGKQSLSSICDSCQKQELHFDHAFSPCLYEGAIKELIQAFKYKNKDYLAGLLAKPMIEFIKEYNLPIENIDLIMAVPLSAAKLREREFNQALLLAKRIAEEFNKETLENVLLRKRNTRSQTELKDSQRLENVAGAFSIKDNIKIVSKDILLIDDVLTTGATASEASKALKDSGAGTVYVLTLAN